MNKQIFNARIGEGQKNIIITVLIVFCCLLTYYFHVVLNKDTIFTHFFYLPVILSALWWQKKGILVALFLSAFLIATHLIDPKEFFIIGDIIRVSIYIFTSIITIILATKITQSHKLLGASNQQLDANNQQLRAVERQLIDANEEIKIRTEKIINSNRNKYLTVFENTGTAMCILENDMTILFVNSKFEEMSGYSRTEIKGKKKWTEFVTKEYLEKMKKYHHNRRQKKGKAPTQYEFEFKNRKGKCAQILLNVNMIPETNRSVASLLDITDRKKAEEKLRLAYQQLQASEQQLKSYNRQLIATEQQLRAEMEERKKTMNILRLSEEKTRTIYETASEGILTAEIKTDTITNVNAAICNMSGYDKEELIGMMIQDIVSSASFENVMAEFKALKKGEKNIIVDIPLKKKNGKIIYIDISTSKAVLNGKKCLICFITDITEKKRIKEEEDKIARLESLSHLSAGIAHDFNNYLAGILGNISLLKLNIVSGSDNHRLLNEMEHITMIATNLTNRLLDFSKGGSISIMKQFELSEMLKTTADFSLSGSDIKLDLEISKDIWDISGDSSQLGRVIGNILINGQQAMPVGGRISFKANNIHLEEKEISDLRKGKYVKISIKDTGIGIKKTDLNFIFDPFFTTKQMGSGLGLASVYSIIKNHKGYIQVESESGKGTVFTIYLPALGTKFTPAKKSTGKDIIGKGKILFMDDQDFLRESVSKILTKFGHEVITSSDGEEAVKLFKKELHSKHPFDIVILDMTVPGGKGGEWTIKKLTAISPYVKAIVSSGYSDIPVMSNPKKYGFKAAVKKPFDVYELAKTVKKVMEG